MPLDPACMSSDSFAVRELQLSAGKRHGLETQQQEGCCSRLQSVSVSSAMENRCVFHNRYHYLGLGIFAHGSEPSHDRAHLACASILVRARGTHYDGSHDWGGSSFSINLHLLASQICDSWPGRSCSARSCRSAGKSACSSRPGCAAAERRSGHLQVGSSHRRSALQ